MAGYALLVGPDGSGKSTITDGIALRANQAGVQVRTADYRPGLIAGRPPGANVTTRPHEQTERGFLASVGKLVLLAADARQTEIGAREVAPQMMCWRALRCFSDPARFAVESAIQPTVP
jgi:hypothetical protein